jgi:leucyl-tRNA synthetase
VVTKIASDAQKGKVVSQSSRLIHKTIKKISDDIESQNYNTAVSALMIQFNGVDGEPDWRPKTEAMKGEYACDLDALKKFLILLAPFAPHIAEELWKLVGGKTSICSEIWPTYDESMLRGDTIQLIVQVNGKMRDRITVPADITEQAAEKFARESKNVARFLQDQEIKNVIFVPGRLINFVI